MHQSVRVKYASHIIKAEIDVTIAAFTQPVCDVFLVQPQVEQRHD